MVNYLAGIERLQLLRLQLVAALLRRHQNEAAVALHHSGGNLNANEILLARLDVEFEARLLVVRVKGMLARLDFNGEVAAVVHARELRLVAVDGGLESAAHKLLVAVDVNRPFGRLGARLS